MRAWLADQVPDARSRRYRVGATARSWSWEALRGLRTGSQRFRTAVQPPHGSAAGQTVVTVSGRRLPAQVSSHANTDERHHAAVAGVHEALTGAGVGYFAYTQSTTRVRLGIRRADQAAALHAVERWASVTGSAMVRVAGPTGDVDRVGAPRLGLDQPTMTLGLPVTDPGGHVVLGVREGVALDWWDGPSDGTLVTRAANRWTAALPAEARRPGQLPFGELLLPTYEPFAGPHVDDILFPVDAVICWVDGTDPAWRSRYVAAGGSDLRAEANAARYQSVDELRHALRSIATFAPWLRHVYLVTDAQRPTWLREGNGLSLVDHRRLWTDQSALPVFNSHAIEARLHHLDGLAEQWVYFNDDFFLGRGVLPEMFFAGNGAARFFASPLHVGFGTEQSEGTPALAGRTSRKVLSRATGRVQTHKLSHAPYPQRRSVAHELEERFPAEYSRTSHAPFRSGTDIAPITLQTWYGWATGRFLPGELEERYFDLRVQHLDAKLRYLQRHRHVDSFCLNMGEESGSQLEANIARVAAFLPSYFPFVSPWERDGEELP